MDYYSQQAQRIEPYIRNKRELKISFLTCNYTNKQERDQAFPHLSEVNQSKASLNEKGMAFVIRSNNDDDIHKSIKYGIWTSSKENNEKLTQAYKEAQANGTEVYLFYSVVKSGQFVGVAQLTSGYKEESFPFWWETKKWKGHFTVKWVQVKDVINKNFDHLKNMESVEVTRSRDGAQVDWTTSGREMMKIYEAAADSNTILNDFSDLDLREQALRDHKQHKFNGPQNNHNNYYTQQPPQMFNQYYAGSQYQQQPYQQQQQYQPQEQNVNEINQNIQKQS